MLKIVETIQNKKVQTWYNNYIKDTHIEKIKVTTVYFLFIPIYISHKLLK